MKYKVVVFFNTGDFYALRAKAKAAKLSLAEVARRAATGCQVVERFTPEPKRSEVNEGAPTVAGTGAPLRTEPRSQPRSFIGRRCRTSQLTHPRTRPRRGRGGPAAKPDGKTHHYHHVAVDFRDNKVVSLLVGLGAALLTSVILNIVQLRDSKKLSNNDLRYRYIEMRNGIGRGAV